MQSDKLCFVIVAASSTSFCFCSRCLVFIVDGIIRVQIFCIIKLKLHAVCGHRSQKQKQGQEGVPEEAEEVGLNAK